MRVLMVGPFEEWVKTEKGDLEVIKVASLPEAMEAVATFEPSLTVVDPSIVGTEREVLARHAEAFGSYVVAARAGVKIPGTSMQEIERYAILETLKSVGGSTSRAAKVLGISVRKIQYRLKDWNLRPAELTAHLPIDDARH